MIKESHVVNGERVCPHCLKPGVLIVMKQYRYCSYCYNLLEEVVWNSEEKAWKKADSAVLVLV